MLGCWCNPKLVAPAPTVIPMRTHQTQGRGTDRADCMRQFRAAWERFAGDEANLTEFMAAKSRARRPRNSP